MTPFPVEITSIFPLSNRQGPWYIQGFWWVLSVDSDEASNWTTHVWSSPDGKVWTRQDTSHEISVSGARRIVGCYAAQTAAGASRFESAGNEIDFAYAADDSGNYRISLIKFNVNGPGTGSYVNIDNTTGPVVTPGSNFEMCFLSTQQVNGSGVPNGYYTVWSNDNGTGGVGIYETVYVPSTWAAVELITPLDSNTYRVAPRWGGGFMCTSTDPTPVSHFFYYSDGASKSFFHIGAQYTFGTSTWTLGSSTAFTSDMGGAGEGAGCFGSYPTENNLNLVCAYLNNSGEPCELFAGSVGFSNLTPTWTHTNISTDVISLPLTNQQQPVSTVEYSLGGTTRSYYSYVSNGKQIKVATSTNYGSTWSTPDVYFDVTVNPAPSPNTTSSSSQLISALGAGVNGAVISYGFNLEYTGPNMTGTEPTLYVLAAFGMAVVGTSGIAPGCPLLPSIGGVEGQNGTIKFGNFFASNGGIYEVVWDGAITDQIYINESTDGGLTWTDVTGRRIFGGSTVSVDFVGDVIYISSDSGNDFTYEIYRFTTATNSFLTGLNPPSPVTTPSPTGIYNFLVRDSVMAVRPDGNIVWGYRGGFELVSGINYARAFSSLWNGSSWSAGAQLPGQSGVAMDFSASEILISPDSYRAHIFLTAFPPNHVTGVTAFDLYHVTLDASNVAHTLQLLSNDGTDAETIIGPGMGVAWLNAGTSRVAIPAVLGGDNSGGPGGNGPAPDNYVFVAIDADNPTWTSVEFDSVNSVWAFQPENLMSMAASPDGSVIYIFYVAAENSDGSGGDVWMVKSTDEGVTWSTPVSLEHNDSPLSIDGVNGTVQSDGTINLLVSVINVVGFHGGFDEKDQSIRHLFCTIPGTTPQKKNTATHGFAIGLQETLGLGTGNYAG